MTGCANVSSDLHCDREAALNIVRESVTADVVVGAGDFGIRGERSTELLDILKDIGKPVLLVSGNHDRCCELASYCASSKDMHLLDGSSQTVDDVLLTHTPPYGYCDLQKDGAHEGSTAIANAIKKLSPSLCLCGHIHHSWGSIDLFGRTTVHNLGPSPVGIPCRIVDEIVHYLRSGAIAGQNHASA